MSNPSPASSWSLLITLASLKLALLRHSPSGLRRGGRVAGLAAVAATWAVVVLAGSDPARRSLLMLAAAIWAAGWLLGPMLAAGTGVLRPAQFELLPLPRRRLGIALLGASFAGYGPAITVAGLAALGYHAAVPDLAGGWLAVPAVGLLVGFVVVLSRLFFGLVGAAMRSRFGIEISAIQYGALVAAIFVGWMVAQHIVKVTPELIRHGLPDGPLLTGLSALPTSWPVHAIEAAAAGQWEAAAGWLAGLAALTGLLAAIAAVALTPRSGGPTRTRRSPARSGPAGGPAASSRPGGRLQPRRRTGRWLALPATPLGAVLGKELRLWWRDPWRRLELRTVLWSGLLVGTTGLLTGYSWAAPFAGVIVALGPALIACNLYGHDGTALWLTVVGQGAGTLRADIRGRQLAITLLVAGPAALLGGGFLLLAGEPGAWLVVPALTLAVLGAGSGLAMLLSVAAATPGLDPKQRVGPNDTGDVTFQINAVLLSMPVLVAPTGLVAGAAAATGSAGLAVVAILVGAGNGLAAGWWLGRLAHQRLARRLPELFGRLRYGHAGSLLVPAGGGWLAALERGAAGTNQQRPTRR